MYKKFLQIVFLYVIMRHAAMVELADGICLESRRTARFRGFKSLSLRFLAESIILAFCFLSVKILPAKQPEGSSFFEYVLSLFETYWSALVCIS